MIRPPLQNSFLGGLWNPIIPNFEIFNRQVIDSVGWITQQIEKRGSKIKISKTNFLTIFNLQFDLDEQSLDHFNWNSRLRAYVYLFSKFFNRNILSQKLEGFWEEIDLRDQKKILNFINKGYYFNS